MSPCNKTLKKQSPTVMPTYYTAIFQLLCFSLQNNALQTLYLSCHCLQRSMCTAGSQKSHEATTIKINSLILIRK